MLLGKSLKYLETVFLLVALFLQASVLANFLGKLISAFQNNELFALREISNHAIDKAALENDKELARIALIAYSLHKLAGKHHIVSDDRWKDVKHDVLFDLRLALKAIQAGNIEEFDFRLKAAIDSVQQSDKKMGYFVQDVFEKARVKHASVAYGMGLGLGQAAELTGADKKELLRYIGVTRLADRDEEDIGIAGRLRKLKEKIGKGGK